MSVQTVNKVLLYFVALKRVPKFQSMFSAKEQGFPLRR